MSTAPKGLDLLALNRYLRENLPGVVADVKAELVEGGRSNLTYRISDGERAWALRRPPFGTIAQSANDVSREFRITTALGDGPVPVPAPVLYCDDRDVIGA